jgi:hypothetical protein
MDLFDVVEVAATTRRMKFQDDWFTGCCGMQAFAHAVIPDTVPGDVLFTHAPSGNRTIAVVTPLGNVILQEMERDARQVLLWSTKLLEGLWGKGLIPEDQLESLLGLWGKDNVGIRIQQMLNQQTNIHETKGG